MYNFMTKRVTYSRRYHTVITHVIKEPLTQLMCFVNMVIKTKKLMKSIDEPRHASKLINSNKILC